MTANLTETGHVLFLDLVGYSLLSHEAQAARVTELLACVRSTKAFQSAEQVGELIPIATGDGVALVFLRYALAPLICACEVREKAAALPLRMGIHVGPVTRVSDINGAVSVTGSGINTAKRVMDLADGGQIFLSDAAVALVREHDAWKERLEFVGERDTKHGERVRVWELVPWMRTPVSKEKPPSSSAGILIHSASPGGAVPLTSEHYVVRAIDGQFHAALQAQSAIVLLKGARQVGKTSLLARGLQAARQRGAHVVI